MRHLETDYYQFFNSHIDESIDYEKISSLKDRMRTLTKRMYQEKDAKKKKRLSLEIKVIEYKIMIAQLD
jgi:hypothetical protein